MILFFAIGSIVFVAFLGYFFLYKNQQKDIINLETDWQKFLKAKSNNDIKGIKDYGNLQVYNKYLR
ncbi:hypothetical protein [Winogradskyella endarachnes]|uniref:Uncharacterized protein n=1 Tax=Winogradskyella endarachnes TaxID=2681965 RepID=A0A6L6U6P8_9FLAO|nr:hypothetical protein [Winogradskyella endarachnes]MUU77848.1 hypothetical protein [Winogradskyella endarachnes]